MYYVKVIGLWENYKILDIEELNLYRDLYSNSNFSINYFKLI